MLIPTFASGNNKPLCEYLTERFKTINQMKHLELDIDEIDTMGFILDKSLNNGYSTLADNWNNIRTRISISNGAYRESMNNMMFQMGMNAYMDGHASKEVQAILESSILLTR